MSASDSVSVKKVPFKAYVFILMGYILPYIMYGFAFVITGGMSWSEAIIYVANPIMAVCFVAALLIPTLNYRYANKKLAKYDGSEEQIIATNKFIKLYEVSSLGIAVVCSSGLINVLYSLIFTILRVELPRVLSGRRHTHTTLLQ